MRPASACCKHLGVDVEQHDRVDRLAEFTSSAASPSACDDRARKSVEDESARGIGPREPLADDAEHDVVGDELARVHHDFGGAAELRAGRDRFAQQVAGRHLRHAVAGLQALRLRALARTGRAEQNQPHFVKLRGRWPVEGRPSCPRPRYRVKPGRIGYASPPTGRVGALQYGIR